MAAVRVKKNCKDENQSTAEVNDPESIVHNDLAQQLLLFSHQKSHLEGLKASKCVQHTSNYDPYPSNIQDLVIQIEYLQKPMSLIEKKATSELLLSFFK